MDQAPTAAIMSTDGPGAGLDQPSAPSVPDLGSDEEILAALARFRANYRNRPQGKPGRPEDGGSYTGFAYPSDANPLAWVKIAKTPGEPRMHRFAYEQLLAVPEERRRGIRVPQIYRVIDNGSLTCIVMEYVRGTTVETLYESKRLDEALLDRLTDRVAQALSLFLHFPVPPGTKPGAGEGSLIRHIMFKWQEAVIEYDSVAQLEAHLNNIIRVRGGTLTLNFTNERMCFCYTDLHDHNFIYTGADDDTLIIIDFEHAAFLPVSFMAYAIFCGPYFFSGTATGKRMRSVFAEGEGEDNKNLHAMAILQHVLTVAYPTIGQPAHPTVCLSRQARLTFPNRTTTTGLMSPCAV
ncbi:hypothetical protein VTK73DRAFT_10310 [Phialemonium thermophilum]|uniref:Aminoglycoside phosphotransferase domain-containing protein n=1 Tax=Phialemonium thermophilum TaxID=223376 RepID=A0ABR3XG71_9PEZI